MNLNKLHERYRLQICSLQLKTAINNFRIESLEEKWLAVYLNQDNTGIGSLELTIIVENNHLTDATLSNNASWIWFHAQSYKEHLVWFPYTVVYNFYL